jgi:hypothetical protein
LRARRGAGEQRPARAGRRRSGRDRARATPRRRRKRSALHALSAARARRFAIASTWLENASAVSACRPDDAKARADRNAAHAEVNASAMPSGPGMR